MVELAELSALWLVRHGESTGNVAALAAEKDGSEVIDIPQRDADVPLSERGQEQAAAVGHWLTGLDPAERPDLVVVSPYRRTRETAATVLGDLAIETIVDERLRDRELGVIDLLTVRGVEARLPTEAARRRRLGKFYYRPPGGESWTDVVLRLRSLLRDLRLEYPGRKVLLVTHDAVVLLVRYIVERLTEEELIAVTREHTMANCSISEWRRGPDGLVSVGFNQTGHLDRLGVETTRQPEVVEQTRQEEVDA
jgi:2,3-bisphosphoglycerate-dependent phosphoglycerate mutase